MKAVLFDLDGTLLNSTDLLIECYEVIFERYFNEHPTRQDLLKVISRPLITYLEEKLHDRSKAEEIAAAFRKEQRARHDELIKVFPGVVEVLTLLKEQGLNIGLVTSKGKEGVGLAKTVMEEAFSYFDVEVLFEDTTSHKPAPEPLLLAAKKLQIEPSECIYVGDSTHDMNAARNAGMKGIALTWGADNAETLSSLTPYVIDDLSHLPALVTSLNF